LGGVENKKLSTRANTIFRKNSGRRGLQAIQGRPFGKAASGFFEFLSKKSTSATRLPEILHISQVL
jgi:hypothetical protein